MRLLEGWESEWFREEAKKWEQEGGSSLPFLPMNDGTHFDLHVRCLPRGSPYQGFYTVVHQPDER